MPINPKSKTPARGTYDWRDQFYKQDKAEVKSLNKQTKPLSTSQRETYNSRLKDISNTRLGARDSVKASNASAPRAFGKKVVTQDNRPERVNTRTSGVRVNNKPIKATRMAMAERVVRKGIMKALPKALGRAYGAASTAILAREAGKEMINAAYTSVTGKPVPKKVTVADLKKKKK